MHAPPASGTAFRADGISILEAERPARTTMGNCACRESPRHAASWNDGDGETWAPEQEGSGEVRTGVEVTIRISKRRLQEAMAKAAGGGEGMTVEKVLAEIVMGASEVVGGRDCRRWEPALQSIPEGVES